MACSLEDAGALEYSCSACESGKRRARWANPKEHDGRAAATPWGARPPAHADKYSAQIDLDRVRRRTSLGAPPPRLLEAAVGNGCRRLHAVLSCRKARIRRWPFI